MAHFVFNDGKAVINAVDLSAHCVSIETEGETVMAVDGPCMGHLVEKQLPVIKRGKVRARFKLDFAAAQVHATLFPLWNNKTAHDVRLRPTAAVVSGTNPDVTGLGAYLSRYTPLKGNFGDVPEVECEWSNVDIAEDITP